MKRKFANVPRRGGRAISPVMPPDVEQALRARVAVQARLEETGDISGLCDLILPAYRTLPVEMARSRESFGRFIPHVRSTDLVSFEVESWTSAVERFGGAPAAVVRSAIRYNGSSEPASYRTIWVRVDGTCYTTAVGKLWFTASS